MGMLGYYLAVDSKTAEKLKNNKFNLFDFFYGGEKYNKENTLDIDKTWHALFYLLSKLSHEDENLVYAVPMQNECAFGFDSDIPIFWIEASKVVKAAEAVNKVTREKLLENYNIEDMLEFNIYPIQEGEDAEEFFEYVYNYFVDIQKFLSKAANENKEIIFSIA